MTHRASIFSLLFPHAVRGFPLLLALAIGLALPASAQDVDPPGRVVFMNQQQGTVSVSPAGDDSWYDAVPNRPLVQGDRLWTDRGARAELYVGATAVRADEQTHLAISELDDNTLRLTMEQGLVQLRVRDDLAGQRIELGTGNLAVVVRAPGDYRVLADAQAGTTQVMVAQGSVTVYGENGTSQELGSRQQAVFSGRDLAPAGAPVALNPNFEQWVAERNLAEEQSQSARYVSRELPGYQQLDAYGEWQNDPGYGAVWYPRDVGPSWVPYSDGYWAFVAPWGWTWIDRARWGFAPFHYGRWARFGHRWGWVPGHRHVRPVYSPALVAFVGGGPAGNFTAQGGRPAVGWFPLAPGDRWRPPYRASARYVDRANSMVTATRDAAPAYPNRALPNAVTAVPVDRFGRGGPISRRDHVRPPEPRVLNQAQVLSRPPVQWPTAGVTGPGGTAGAMGFPGRRSSAVPPASIQARQQPEGRQRFEQGQRDPRDQGRSAQRQQEVQERAARDQQDFQRRAMQEPQQRTLQQAQQQQMQMHQQELMRRQAELQQESAQRQAQQQQQQQQNRRRAEQQEQQSRRLVEQAQLQDQARRQTDQQQAQAQRQAQQQELMRRHTEQQQQQQDNARRRQAEQQAQQEQARRQVEQQQAQAQRQAQQQQQEQMRRQAEQQSQQMQMQQRQQQEQARRQAEQQQAQAQRQAQQQQQAQQQEQMRRQAEQQQAHAQRQAQQQQEQMRRQMEQQQQAQQAQRQAQQQQQQMQQQAEQQARQREQQQRQQQQQQGGQRQQRGGGPQRDDQQQRP